MNEAAQPPSEIAHEDTLRVDKRRGAEVEVANARRARLAGEPAPVKADSILAFPLLATIDPSDTPAIADHILAKVDEVDHIAVLDETLAWTGMISGYLRGRSRDALQQLARADRAVEVRIGELLGPTQQGKRTDLDPTCPGEDKLPRQRAAEFRLMAAYKDHPAVAQALSTGESRAKILGLIKAARGDTEPADTTTAPQVYDEAGPVCGTADHGLVIETDAILNPADENDPPAPDTADTRASEGSPRRQDALEIAEPTLPTTGQIIEVTTHEEAAPDESDPLQTITDAVQTLTDVADDLEQTEPGDVAPGDLAPLVDSMGHLLRRLDRAHRLMKDWLT